MQDAMERLNLNVPPPVRSRLKVVAARAGRTESEMARTLLMSALEAAWREAFYQEVAETYTPAMRARTLEVLRALDKLDG